MSDEASARLGLPYLVPGQAQKEMTHNEALAMIDIAIGGAVTGTGTTAVPADPLEGECWIVGAGAGGAWAGQGDALAGWTAGGWRFVAAHDGMTVRTRDSGRLIVYRDGAWRTDAPLGVRGDAIADPTGGVTIDIEARATIAAMLLKLRDFGLIDVA